MSRWREANKRIRDLWYSMDNAAVQVITQGGSVGINGLLLAVSMTTTKAPTVSPSSSSGRKLYYVSPGIVKTNGATLHLLHGHGPENQAVETHRNLRRQAGGELRQTIAVTAWRTPLSAWRHPACRWCSTSMMRWSLTPSPRPMMTPCWTRWSTSCASPSRAADLPLNADGWVGTFFKKD
ncbi:MAG: hypothetical protein ACLSF6_03395 [Evtepia gabavorous]